MKVTIAFSGRSTNVPPAPPVTGIAHSGRVVMPVESTMPTDSADLTVMPISEKEEPPTFLQELQSILFNPRPRAALQGGSKSSSAKKN